MPNKSFHIAEQDLLLAADGELSPRRMVKVRDHLAVCWSCRARMDEIEASIVEFARMQGKLNAQVPPSKGPRAQFQAKLAELARTAPPSAWERLLTLGLAKRVVVPVCVALSLVLGIAAWRLQRQTINLEPAPSYAADGVTPDPSLTPGMAQPLTRTELCAIQPEDTAPDVPRPVALRIFASYGITDPSPRVYELDYLITPELGGVNDVRNLWPQPYHAGPWNAHAKDALEDRLYGLVCEGRLDLATAQRDLAADWVAAYRKYFQTEDPLPIHAAFLKDRPWE